MSGELEFQEWTQGDVLKADMVRHAEQLMNTPYVWAGNMVMGNVIGKDRDGNPTHGEGGLDCSGLCVELLKGIGIVANKTDHRARDLYEQFKHGEVKQAAAGCLVFFGKSVDNIIHVELCVDEFRSIGASGGGSRTVNLEEAVRTKAFIKRRNIVQRGRNVVAIVDPTVGFEPEPVEV